MKGLVNTWWWDLRKMTWGGWRTGGSFVWEVMTVLHTEPKGTGLELGILKYDPYQYNEELWQAMRKRRKKIFYKNSLEFWPFYPPRSNPDPMAKSHLNSMVDKLTFHIHTPFSQTNRAFPCVWITQECAYLPVNTAISGFADGTEPECSLVFRFYALIVGWECECYKIGGNLILTRKIEHLCAPHPNNCTSRSSLQASTSLCLHMDHLRIWWKCRSGAAPEILCFEVGPTWCWCCKIPGPHFEQWGPGGDGLNLACT